MVLVEQLSTGRRRTIPCDTVITTGDWIPDHELARLAGLDLDGSTRGPVVDASLATSGPGVFAVGNLVHPVDTADGAALDGRHVATAVARWLASGGTTGADDGAPSVDVTVAAPLRWVTPQRMPVVGGAPRAHLLLWTDEYRRLPGIRAMQGGAEVGRLRTPWPAAPGRIFRVPERVLAGADPTGGQVTLHLT